MERQDADTPTAIEQMGRTILCLYAQADEPFYLQLKKSLNLWERGGQVRWLEVLPGDEPAAAWQRDVKRADLILLLLSPDFFPDDLCYHTMHLALQGRAARQMSVVPVLIRAVDWRASACKELAVVPHNEQPVASWALRDEAFASIGVDLARLLPAWGLLVPTRSTVFRVPDLPEGYVPRPAAFQEIKSAVLEKRTGQTMAITTALRGAGGFGKTTLAMALCHDSDIQAAFPEILWVELGEQPPRALDLLNRLLAFLEGSPVEALTLQEARERWHMALRYRVCLLVIDDAWQAEVLLPLLEGGPQCVRLVTTRNDLLLSKETARVLVDAMESGEAVTLLCQDKHLPADIYQAGYRPQLEALVERLGCWPLLLTLARGMFTNLVVDYHLSIAEALTTITEAYQTRGVTAFRLDNVEERQRTVEACLKVSLQHLEDLTHPHYRATERYQELAVFPEDTNIPLATLQAYWKGSAGLEPWETKDLCIHLHRLSLLLICDLESGTIRFHGVLRNYLIQRVGSHLPELHGRLLDVYRQEYGLTRWADLPQSEAYLWQHLVLHLHAAARYQELRETLTDLRYLICKVLKVGVADLEADLFLASTFPPGETSEPTLFAHLHRNIARMSHLLRQVQTPADIGGVLLSQLAGEPALAASSLALEQELPRPFLMPWHSWPDRASSPLLRILRGHTAEVICCTFSSDGRFLLSASRDHTLRIWNVATGTECLSFTAHANEAIGCTFSRDGSVVISVFSDGTIKLWDTATGGERLSFIAHPHGITCCSCSHDGSTVASASSDGTIKLWDTATGGERLSFFDPSSSVLHCAISPDGRFLLTATSDGKLKLWDTATGRKRFTHILNDRVCHCTFSPDGLSLLIATFRQFKVLDAVTGKKRLTLTITEHPTMLLSCAFSPSGRLLLSTSSDGTLGLWSVSTGANCLALKGHTGGVTGCAFSPDGNVMASSSADGTLKLWDAATKAQHLSPPDSLSEAIGGAFSSDGRFFFSGHEDGTLKLWDMTTGKKRFFCFEPFIAIFSCAFSPDSRTVVYTSGERALRVCDIASRTEFLTLKGHTNRVWCCAFSPDGCTIVSASLDHTLKIWDAATGTELLTLRGHGAKVFCCAFSHDGRFVVSASADNSLKIWDATTGTELLTLRGHTESVAGCAFSHDGRSVVSASADNSLKIWDAATGAQRLTLTGHTKPVLGCSVSPDGHFIISTSEDGTLKVWDARMGNCLLTFPFDGVPNCCLFHPDGKHLVACGTEGIYFLRLVV